MLFIIDGAVYAVASPLIGFLLDRWKRTCLKCRCYGKPCTGCLSLPCACLEEQPLLGLDSSSLLHHPSFLTRPWPRSCQEHIPHDVFFDSLSFRSVWVLDCMVLECLLVSLPLSPLWLKQGGRVSVWIRSIHLKSPILPRYPQNEHKH